MHEVSYTKLLRRKLEIDNLCLLKLVKLLNYKSIFLEIEKIIIEDEKCSWTDTNYSHPNKYYVKIIENGNEIIDKLVEQQFVSMKNKMLQGAEYKI